MNNIKALILVVAAIAVAFFIGRCSKKPTNVEKIVEKEVTVWPDSIPLPEVIVEKEVKYIVDRKEVSRLQSELDFCNDSVDILATLLVSKQILGDIRVVHDTITDSVYVEVPQKTTGDTKSGKHYTATWQAWYKGELDRFSLDVDVDCGECPKERTKSFAFGAGLKSNIDRDFDIPLSVSFENNGFDKGLTLYPMEKAVSVDLKWRFRYDKIRLNPFKK